MEKKFFFLIFFALSAVKFSNAQDAALKDSSKILKEATFVYQAGRLTPVSYQNLYGNELRGKSVGQEPSFLLAETPSITNYSDAGNSQGYSYFRLRGIDQTRINITLDGVPLNEPEDQGSYFSNYPDLLNSVSKLQIQRGVATSKNGVASYGGSIQLFSPNLNDSAKAVVGFGFGSFNSLRAFGEYNSGLRKRKALYVRASQVYSDGYKYHSANSSQSIFLSSGWFLNKSTWKFNVLAGQQRNELAWLGVPDSSISSDRRTNANKNENDHFIQFLTQVKNDWTLNPFSSLQTSVYYTFLQGNYDFNLNGFLGQPSTGELYNYAFRSNLVGVFSNYAFSKKHISWVNGFHANHYEREHIGSDNMLGQLYRNTGYKNEMSLFTKLDYKINKFIFFSDVQYRISSFDYRGSVALPEMNWSFLNPKIGVSYGIKSNSILYYNIGRTGREPTRNDMFGGNDDLLADSLGRPVIFNRNPEYVIDQEVGIRHLFGKLGLNFNLFYMDFKNEIVLDGNFGKNGLALTDNVDRSIRTGAELNITCRLNDHFEFVNNSSFNYSRIEEQKETFTPILTPLFIVNQEAIYSCKNFSFSLVGRFQDRSFIDFANSATVDRYFLLNGRIAYTFSRFQFCFFMNNLTNAKYYSSGYIDTDGSKRYFVQAPTNLYLSIKYRI